MKAASLVFFLLFGTSQAGAFQAPPEAKTDAKRFGLDRPEAPARQRRRKAAPQAAARRDQLKRAASSLRYSPAGTVTAAVGPIPSRGGPPEDAARGFLYDYREALEIDPADLTLNTRRDGAGGTHLLFTQTHAGIPVEFARVKVHLGKSGEVLALHSSHEPDIEAPPTPRLSAAQAAQSVASELGGGPPAKGTLVYLPVPKTGEVRLAWKFKSSGANAVWYYYVDADNGAVLLRYNDLRFAACNSGTHGTVTGEVFNVDPTASGSVPDIQPLAHQKVWMFSTIQTTFAVTEADGSFCNTGTPGKIFTALQGPYVSVSHFTQNAARYDNGGGTWFTAATPVASPSPYPNGSRFPNSVVFSAGISAPAPPQPQFTPGSIAVAAIANFDFFRVGTQSPDGDIGDDDQVHVYNSDGNRIASYNGTRQPFHSAPVHGCLICDQSANKPAMRLDLQANETGQELGFRVNVSSYLVLTNNPTAAANPSNVVWSSSMTSDATRDEINLFYHLNRMHDYFIGDVDKSSAAWISSGVVATAHFGPNLSNAFFNPDHNNFAFGDAGGGIALDATVIHHEFVHFVVDKIFPIINFGQDGAISEGLADYFSASSLNNPSIGKFVGSSFGGESALRELACTPAPGGFCAPGGTPQCRCFPQDWAGEIHEDSLPLSQALWELRADLRGTLGNAPGQSCADGLVFNALFFFPDSFQEMLDAMLIVDAAGTVAACGGANATRSAILNRLGAHGITMGSSAFAYEPNDGTQSAADISTLAAVTASLYPAADLDYYSFGAGPGRIHATLVLPEYPGTPGSHYAYGLTLVDNKLRSIKEAFPPLDVNPSLGGACPLTDCQTSAGEVVLEYDNPSPDQFYLLVSAGLSDSGSNSATNSQSAYTLRFVNPQAGALSGAVVDAKTDNDQIDFTVAVGSFSRQNLRFSHAQLRDHRLQPIPDTRTDVPGGFLALQGLPVSADGRIAGSVRLQTSGGKTFTARYPSLGTVYLEVFAINELQFQAGQFPGAGALTGVAQSVGLSSPINLTAATAKLTAFNNVFNPEKGQFTTLKYELKQPGRVRLQLFTRTGALVSTLVDDVVTAGKGSVDWNGRNLAGQVVASGVYLLRLDGPGGAHTTQKVIIVK